MTGEYVWSEALKSWVKSSADLYEVYVGNIGLVHKCYNLDEAMKVYHEYVEMSKSGYGRAANEMVSLSDNHGDLLEEYLP